MRITNISLYPKSKEQAKQNRLTPAMRSVLKDIARKIKDVDLNSLATKVSKEKTMSGKVLVSPKELNRKFEEMLSETGWSTKLRMNIQYAVGAAGKGSREIDFVKDRVGCEVQFGKYAFTHYDVFKLQMFQQANHIDLGVLIVPAKALQAKMSSGCPCFDSVAHDMDFLNYDRPLLILGIEG